MIQARDAIKNIIDLFSKALGMRQDISYNDKISLMGYIHDDVYVLHNFKESKLANNNIQYRLVDADEQSSVYMVKASDIKLLVKATNNSMNTEIML